MNITSPLAFKLIFKHRIRNRFNLLKLADHTDRAALGGDDTRSERSVCSSCSPNKPQLESYWPRKEEEGSCRGGKPLLCAQKGSCEVRRNAPALLLPLLCTLLQYDSLCRSYLDPAGWCLDLPTRVQLLASRSSITWMRETRDHHAFTP